MLKEENSNQSPDAYALVKYTSETGEVAMVYNYYPGDAPTKIKFEGDNTDVYTRDHSFPAIQFMYFVPPINMWVYEPVDNGFRFRQINMHNQIEFMPTLGKKGGVMGTEHMTMEDINAAFKKDYNNSIDKGAGGKITIDLSEKEAWALLHTIQSYYRTGMATDSPMVSRAVAIAYDLMPLLAKSDAMKIVSLCGWGPSFESYISKISSKN
jgi:hypothetical protein